MGQSDVGKGHAVPGVPQAQGVKIIFDTDIHTDCDDAGAMAVLHALADRGECEILAMMCSTKDPFSAPVIDVINTYYGRPDIPIGIPKREGVLRKSKYTRGVATEFPAVQSGLPQWRSLRTPLVAS